ncbi:hypothetical protein AQI95_42235 [Streptomyces yokosukanensis]|uniref:Chaplin domain-containing protein n=1 Tax=Streptomyces yokosukanensis TaxID=67386 RepID=A0A117PXA7_9ACTN|nr:hypothetical protein [Streptomyces yokosukanensis]KUM97071.1 hypothetical protein AQI95_42235 [Streptomyces yokosukanensis]
MRNIQKAAVAAAIIAGASLVGTGPANALTTERMHPSGGCIDILGEVGVLNGLLGNLLNGEGSPGGQGTQC